MLACRVLTTPVGPEPEPGTHILWSDGPSSGDKFLARAVVRLRCTGRQNPEMCVVRRGLFCFAFWLVVIGNVLEVWNRLLQWRF